MKTRSISLLLVLALFVTIGGVYATWVFAETPLNAVHGHIGGFSLSDASTNNGKGTITVTASNVQLTIDQAAVNNYHAVLKSNEAVVTVVFHPSSTWANTNADIDEIIMQYNLKTDNAAPMDFKVADKNLNETITLFKTFNTSLKDDITLTKQTEGDNAGAFVGTIPASALLSLIELNDFTIESYAQYEKVSGKVGSFGNIGIEISEKTNAAVQD